MIDDGREPTAIHDEVARLEVSMDPDRGAVPLRRSEARVPRCFGCPDVEAVVVLPESWQDPAHGFVDVAQRRSP